MHNLSDKLKQYRLYENLTQKDVSNKLGINIKTYSHWENGRTNPDIEMLIKLANFYDITIDELVGREIKTRLEVKRDNDITQLLQAYNQMSDRHKDALKIYINTLMGKNYFTEVKRGVI